MFSGLGRYLCGSLGAHLLNWGMDEWYGLVRLRVFLVVSGMDFASLWLDRWMSCLGSNLGARPLD